MAARPRDHLAGIEYCTHGSFNSRTSTVETEVRPILDFSVNCNPLGPAPTVLEAIRQVDVSRYPDDEARELRDELAKAVSLDVSWVLVGNGSVELIYNLASAYLSDRDLALVAGPTFGEYARACRVAGAEIVEVRGEEAVDFRLDLELFAGIIRGRRPKLAFLCNPNNPTGQFLPKEAVVDLAEVCRDTLLVVDEAYLPFSDRAADLRPLLPSGRLLLLRSLTKDHALAGVRLGYALAHPDVLDALERVRPPWTVNALAQAAGIAALRANQHLEEARRVIAEGRAYLSEGLSGLGLLPLPSTTNFVLVRVGDGSAFQSAMLQRGIYVRDCASFGLPAHVRIAVRTLPECERLVAAAREVVSGLSG